MYLRYAKCSKLMTSLCVTIWDLVGGLNEKALVQGADGESSQREAVRAWKSEALLMGWGK